MKYQKTCLECGRPFTPRHGNQAICGPPCTRNRRLRQMKEANERVKQRKSQKT